MNTTPLEQTISQYLKNLGLEEQKQVLELARALSLSKRTGVPGASLLAFGGSIDKKDLDLMQEAIEKDCEKVTLNEW